MSEEHYSIKEMITEFRSDVKDWIGDLSVDVKQTKEQAFKTNGRLLTAEGAIKEIPALKKEIETLKLVNASRDGGLGWFKTYVLPVLIAVIVMGIGQAVQANITKKQINLSLSEYNDKYKPQ